MLRYFNTGYFSRTLVLLALLLVIWLPAWLSPAPVVSPDHPAPLYRLFLSLSFQNVYVHLGVAFFLTFLSALLLNQIAISFEMTEKISQWGTLAYVLLAPALVVQTALTPFVFVNLLLLLSLLVLLQAVDAKDPIPSVFNAGFLLGLAVLFFVPSVIFLLLLWLALLIFHIAHWRNFVVAAVGLSIPLFFAFTWSFWFDETLLLQSTAEHAFDLQPVGEFLNRPGDVLVSAVLLLMVVIAMLKVNSGLMEKKINVRQTQIVVIYYMLLATAVAVAFGMGQGSLLLTSVPAALLLISAAADSRKRKHYEWGVLLLLLLVLINQYSRLFYAA